jgi:hypothetical protein
VRDGQQQYKHVELDEGYESSRQSTFDDATVLVFKSVEPIFHAQAVLARPSSLGPSWGSFEVQESLQSVCFPDSDQRPSNLGESPDITSEAASVQARKFR